MNRKWKGFCISIKNKEDNSLLIMSPICTHLGCAAGNAEVSMKENEGVEFYCPCHGGKYDEQGINVGGPPPRSLDVFESFIEDKNVCIAILSPMVREKRKK